MVETPLAGRVAIISGGLGDIGRAIATELAQRGADMAIGDIQDEAQAAPLLAELKQLGRRVHYSQVDVSDAEQVGQWLADVEVALGIPDLIIPNAAIVQLVDIRSVTPAQWSREININLNGAFHLAQAGALRLLAANKPGHIVFIGSWAAHAPHTHIPAYCAAKAGLRMLARCMALDLGPHDILVNEVAPGYVNAGLSGQVFRENAQLRESSVTKVPVRRLIETDEVAWQVANLCDPRNKNATGSVVLMDGGLSLNS